MTKPECPRVTESDGVVEVILDRPAQRNAIDARMVTELHAVCEELERHPRPAIITGGTDGVFAGGADIAQLCERGRDDALAGINLRLCSGIAPRMTKLAVDAAPEAHPQIDLAIQAMLFEDDEKYRRMSEFLNRTKLTERTPQ
jgi:Enoyl-CoA hydratase/isomerase